MIRVIVTTVGCDAAVNVGGPVHISHKTFDIEAPELEAFASERMGSYSHRSISGVEILSQTALATEAKDGRAG